MKFNEHLKFFGNENESKGREGLSLHFAQGGDQDTSPPDVSLRQSEHSWVEWWRGQLCPAQSHCYLCHGVRRMLASEALSL